MLIGKQDGIDDSKGQAQSQEAEHHGRHADKCRLNSRGGIEDRRPIKEEIDTHDEYRRTQGQQTKRNVSRANIRARASRVTQGKALGQLVAETIANSQVEDPHPSADRTEGYPQTIFRGSEILQ